MKSLYQLTVEHLQQDERGIKQIAKSADLPVSWLKKMKSGTIKDPSVNRVQRLYEYLTGTKLKV